MALAQSGYERYAKSRIGKPGEILIEKEEWMSEARKTTN